MAIPLFWWLVDDDDWGGVDRLLPILLLPNKSNKSSTFAVVLDEGAEGGVLDVGVAVSLKSRSNKFSILVLTWALIGYSREASSCSL